MEYKEFKISGRPFCPIVKWDEFRRVLSEKEYKVFEKWIANQGVAKEGVYAYDVAEFVKSYSRFNS